eukprot:s1629_g4.t1
MDTFHSPSRDSSGNLHPGSLIGFGAEEWFTILVTEVGEDSGGFGRLVRGEMLGIENEEHYDEVMGCLAEGGIHLCSLSPCGIGTDTAKMHVTKVRCWHPERFVAEYMDQEGRKKLKKAVTAWKRMITAQKNARTRKPVGAVGAAKKRPAAKRPAKAKPKKRGEDKGDMVSLISEGEEEADAEPGEGKPPDRKKLRAMLAATRSRIMGHGTRKEREEDGEDANGGRRRKDTSSAPEKRGLMAGTHLAVQSAQHGERRRKKKEKEKKSPLNQLVKLLKGGKGEKKKKKRSREGREGLGRGLIKPDPDDSGGSGSSSSDSGSSVEIPPKQGEKE